MHSQIYKLVMAYTFCEMYAANKYMTSFSSIRPSLDVISCMLLFTSDGKNLLTLVGHHC